MFRVYHVESEGVHYNVWGERIGAHTMEYFTTIGGNIHSVGVFDFTPTDGETRFNTGEIISKLRYNITRIMG